MKAFSHLVVIALVAGASMAAVGGAKSYAIVDTGQTKCYDNRGEIAPPKPGQPFYGQDAQFQSTPGQLHPQRRWPDRPRQRHRPDLAAQPGHRWRWRADPPRQADLGPGPGAAREAQRRQVRRVRRLAPAVHQGAVFALRRARHRSQRPHGRRTLRASRPTSTRSSSSSPTATRAPASASLIRNTRRAPSMSASPRAGSASSSASTSPTAGSKATTCRCRAEAWRRRSSCICVRGNPAYGKNDFHDNGDGTITDRATGLMWSKADSGQGHELAGRAGLGAEEERGEVSRPRRLAPAEREGIAEHRGLHPLARHEPVAGH